MFYDTDIPSREDQTSVHLSFDTAAYPPEHGPCQILAHSFYSPGMGYCVEIAPGFYLPVLKASIKHALEQGHYLWVSKVDPEYLPVGPVHNFVIKSCLTSAGYDPLICTEQELQLRMAAKSFWPVFRKSGTKQYRIRNGVGSNRKRNKNLKEE